MDKQPDVMTVEECRTVLDVCFGSAYNVHGKRLLATFEAQREEIERLRRERDCDTCKGAMI